MAKLKPERLHRRELDAYIKERALKGDRTSANYKIATKHKKSVASFHANQKRADKEREAAMSGSKKDRQNYNRFRGPGGL